MKSFCFARIAVLCLALAAHATRAAESVPYTRKWDVTLQGLAPGEVLTKLNLNGPGLAAVQSAAVQGDRARVLAELLAYYRGKYPRPAINPGNDTRFPQADRICRHVFQWGPYEPADYGQDVDWTRDPADDIEWVAAMYRFYWAGDLTRAYLATGDEKYARAFVELATDWIAKHPLSEWTRTHPTLTKWKGFAWLDLQTGIRARNMCSAFKAMLHSEAFTPEFLSVLLASLYDHQHKTELIPMGAVHNKAIFEQRGVMNICHTFPEFSDTPRWAKLALERASENLLAQTTPEGIQREWCGGYHRAVTNDAIDMIAKASDLGLEIPEALRQRTRNMCDYLFAVATPDLSWPMFGDTARPQRGPDNPHGDLHGVLLQFSEFWKDPKYAARARIDEKALPDQKSSAFESAGLYVMRSRWSPEGIYLALHCPPPALSGHDQPDNGTFELHAYGRWLLTDSGFYTYGHDRAARAWHRQTRVHQTLTLDGKDSKVDGKLRLWKVSPSLETLVVENLSYDGLVHRRTVWFVDKSFFVFLDEAIDATPGELRVHWTPAAGEGRISADGSSFSTGFEDANVLIRIAGPRSGRFEAEDGWTAWDYGHREARKALSVKHPGGAPASFLTVVVPYRGTSVPEVSADYAGEFRPGQDEARVSISALGKRWQIGRSLEKSTAWCETNGQGRAEAGPPAGGAAEGQEPSTRPAVPDRGVDFERLANLGSPGQEDEFPAIGRDAAGQLWACWVAYDGTSDSVLAARLDNTSESPVILSQGGDHWRPAMCTDGAGRLWATWTQGESGKWDIWGKYLAGGKWSPALRLTRTPGNDLGQKLAVDTSGTMWMTWQSVVERNYEILLAPVGPDGLGQVQNVSRHPANDWEPAIAAGSGGRLWIAWDSYRAGSYDVLVAERRDGQLVDPVGIATSPAYEAHAALAVDHEDRLWVAWDNGGERWGQDNDEGRKLHSERSVEIRCLAGGRLAEPAEPLSAVLRGPLSTFCELPELTVDGEGRLWLFVRHLTDLTPAPRPGGRRSQARGIWNPYVLCYDASGWSQPRALPHSNGRNDMRVQTCLDAAGRVWVVWADDGRQPNRAEDPQDHSVHGLRLSAGGAASGGPAIAAADSWRAVLPAPDARRSRPEPHKLVAGGRQYLLLYGDTHRHTDLSRCGMNFDGSLMDTYRYAIDAAELDFLAISDHDQDLLKHRYGKEKSLVQQYAWWRSEKYCDLFHIEGQFVPLYAYEHGGSFAQRGGHKNVLYLDRGQPCVEQDAPERLFEALRGRTAVVIPHQLADGPSATDWTKWNPEFERVAEIYQARGSYEYKGARPPVGVTRDGHYMWDALAAGVRIGIIASSDHGMVHNAYAGAYCSEVSRTGVMEALRSRRTFGAMDRMKIEFRLGDVVLGQEVQVDQPPRFSVHIQGARPLRKVQIAKSGALVHEVAAGSDTLRFEFVDADLKPAQQAWYYARCEQEDDRFGWSSPIWVEYKSAAP